MMIIMTNKISKKYKFLFEFSERLDALVSLFKKHVKDRQSTKVLQKIYYDTDVTNNLQLILRKKILIIGKLRGFCQLSYTHIFK